MSDAKSSDKALLRTARSAARWVRVNALYDVLLTLGFGVITVVFVVSGAFLALPLGIAGLLFCGWTTHLRFSVASRLSDAVARDDGARFASGMAALRSLLIILFLTHCTALIFVNAL